MKADQQKRTLPDKKLRVLAADDHDAVLQHVVSLLELEFLVVATAKNGQAAIDCVKQDRPHVAVLDLAMPILNGIETAKELFGGAVKSAASRRTLRLIALERSRPRSTASSFCALTRSSGWSFWKLYVVFFRIPHYIFSRKTLA